MANELSTAINTIATLASLPTETTYANGAVKINWQQSSQTTRERMIREFIEYGDHIAYVNPKDGKLWLIDTIAGITPATAVNNFEIIGVGGNSQGKLIGKITANFTIKQFDNGGNTGTPGLIDIPIQISTPTNQPNQDEYAIKMSSQPTTLTGGSVEYSYTDVNTVLTRKKSLYEKRIISLEFGHVFDIQRGQAITFDNTHDEDESRSKTGYGSMVVLRPEYDMTKLTTRLVGIGSFTET